MKSKSHNGNVLTKVNLPKSNVKKIGKSGSEITWKELIKDIKEAQKDPEFMREIDKFIKVTTS